MNKNPILEELYKTRKALLEESGGTLDGLVARLQKEERESGRACASSTERLSEPKNNISKGQSAEPQQG